MGKEKTDGVLGEEFSGERILWFVLLSLIFPQNTGKLFSDFNTSTRAINFPISVAVEGMPNRRERKKPIPRCALRSTRTVTTPVVVGLAADVPRGAAPPPITPVSPSPPSASQPVYKKFRWSSPVRFSYSPPVPFGPVDQLKALSPMRSPTTPYHWKNTERFRAQKLKKIGVATPEFGFRFNHFSLSGVYTTSISTTKWRIHIFNALSEGEKAALIRRLEKEN